MRDDLIHVGMYGDDMLFSLYFNGEADDISDATSKTLKIIRSDGSTPGEVNLSFFTDGTDGKLKYTVPSGTFTVEGKYQFQITIVRPNKRNLTEVQTRDVYESI